MLYILQYKKHFSFKIIMYTYFQKTLYLNGKKKVFDFGVYFKFPSMRI